jgi:hypothetical protein
MEKELDICCLNERAMHLQHILLYVDPGSGSYFIQAIIAAALGALFYFKSIWYRVKAFFTKKPSGKDQQHTPDDNT